MSLTCYNLTDDWGWYVDTEINNETNHSQINIKNNNLNSIDIDEYDYYLNNQIDLEASQSDNIIKDEIIKNKKSSINTILSIGSTTLLTAMVTYIIFVIL